MTVRFVYHVRRCFQNRKAWRTIEATTAVLDTIAVAITAIEEIEDNNLDKIPGRLAPESYVSGGTPDLLM